MVNNVEKTDVEKITFLGKGFGESFILHKSDWGKQVAENVEYMETKRTRMGHILDPLADENEGKS